MRGVRTRMHLLLDQDGTAASGITFTTWWAPELERSLVSCGVTLGPPGTVGEWLPLQPWRRIYPSFKYIYNRPLDLFCDRSSLPFHPKTLIVLERFLNRIHLYSVFDICKSKIGWSTFLFLHQPTSQPQPRA